ncbi:NUDIX domain-containing protein [Candidatus Campbellbacteria bacterium]|nr:MAG: NUDIX domain-containing protein [Candidatus Campbellbacteria bacterium]
MKNNQIELIARAVIIDKDKMLLCENKKRGHYFLPGGHVEFGEGVSDALTREMNEELGVSGVVQELIGVLENTFTIDEEVHHEFNMIFLATLSKTDVVSQEDHIEFHWVEQKDVSGTPLLPKELHTLIPQWFKDKKVFFESNF